MAMVLFSDLVQKKDKHPDGWHIESAGCWAVAGLPATRSAISAMNILGLSLDEHRSQPVTESLLEKFHLVLCMEMDHKLTLRRNYPSQAKKIYLLSEMTEGEQEIDDPVGQPIQTYQSTIQEISRYLESGYKKIYLLAK
jgi:protein-tyrosine-phosphatase